MSLATAKSWSERFCLPKFLIFSCITPFWWLLRFSSYHQPLPPSPTVGSYRHLGRSVSVKKESVRASSFELLSLNIIYAASCPYHLTANLYNCISRNRLLIGLGNCFALRQGASCNFGWRRARYRAAVFEFAPRARGDRLDSKMSRKDVKVKTVEIGWMPVTVSVVAVHKQWYRVVNLCIILKQCCKLASSHKYSKRDTEILFVIYFGPKPIIHICLGI